jgi:hypothetical protein
MTFMNSNITKSPSPGYIVQIPTKHLDTLAGYPCRFYQYATTDAYSRLRVLWVYDERSAHNVVRFIQEVVRCLPFRVYPVRTDKGAEFSYGLYYQRTHQAWLRYKKKVSENVT